MVNNLVNALTEAINNVVPLLKPSPYIKHWWTKELTELKKEKNWLGDLSCRLRGLPDAPIHDLHRKAVNRFRNKVSNLKKKHWVSWLEEATSTS